MAIEVRHNGQVVTVSSSRNAVAVKSPTYTVGVTSGVIISGFPYTGSYEVTPATSEQVMPTRSKMMTNDVTVHSIPYHQTSNESGGYTVSIAS